MRAPSSARTTKLVRNLLIASVFIETPIAFIITYVFGVGPTADTGIAVLLVAGFFVTAVSGVAIVRFSVLPQMVAQATAGRDGAISIACPFSQAAATYGLVAAISTGQGLIALPFAVISLLSFFVLLSYVDEVFPKTNEP